jgi:hypothetical protein
LRTLTLGVLIVSTGTLAALPFRRYQAIPDASAAPAQVTGPAQSALDRPVSPSTTETGDLDPSPAGSLSVAAVDASLASIGLPLSQFPVPNSGVQDAPDPTSADPPPGSSQAHVRPRHNGDVPLTYEDLAMPICDPQVIQRRFNATRRSRESKLQRERVAGLLMPAMESLAVSQQEEIRRVAEAASPDPITTPEEVDSKASASLASAASTTREENLERLPASQPQQRQRHWIRQPN